MIRAHRETRHRACLTQYRGLPRTGKNTRDPSAHAKAAPLQCHCVYLSPVHALPSKLDQAQGRASHLFAMSAILGASGKAGRATVEKLRAPGESVRAVVRE